MSLTLPAVNLGTLAVESFVYGNFFILTIASLVLIVYRNATQQGNGRKYDLSVVKRPMFIGAVCMFIFVTGHWVCTVTRNFHAFINSNGPPVLYFADLSMTTQVVKTAFMAAALVVGDAMMIYRLWVVWGYNRYIIIFPILCLTAAVACSIGISYEFYRFEITMDVFDSAAGRWIRSNTFLTLGTNLFCTSMIAWQIWKANKRITNASSANLLSVLAIFIESAAIYTSWTVFFLITYETKSNLQFNTVDLWALSAGIAFMLINVRVGMGWAQTATQGISSSHGRRNEPSASFAMRPLTVNITQVVDEDRGGPYPPDGDSLENYGKSKRLGESMA